MIWISATFLCTLLQSWLIYRTFFDGQAIRLATTARIFAFGALLALPTRLSVGYVLDSLGWSIQSSSRGFFDLNSLEAVAVAVAAEQLVLLIVVWPAYRNHRLDRLGTALSAAGMGATGFGTVYAVLEVAAAPGLAALLLGLGTLMSRTFVVGIWASCLVTSLPKYKPWIPVAWSLAVVVDGIMRHLLQSRGPSWQVAAIPPLLGMAYVIARLSRKVSRPRPASRLVAMRASIRSESHRLESMRAAFQHGHRPALVHWIFGGALVSFGGSLVGLSLGALAAHSLEIDLSLVDETNAKAAVPLLIIGVGVLLSFPISGFVTAKASVADSLFEPGMSALLSISALTALLARSAPVTLVLGLALAPLAFALACVGAWFGLSTRSHGAEH